MAMGLPSASSTRTTPILGVYRAIVDAAVDREALLSAGAVSDRGGFAVRVCVFHCVGESAGSLFEDLRDEPARYGAEHQGLHHSPCALCVWVAVRMMFSCGTSWGQFENARAKLGIDDAQIRSDKEHTRLAVTQVEATRGNRVVYGNCAAAHAIAVAVEGRSERRGDVGLSDTGFEGE
jgi:hypothetical protein